MVLPFAMVYDLPPSSLHCAHSVPQMLVCKLKQYVLLLEKFCVVIDDGIHGM